MIRRLRHLPDRIFLWVIGVLLLYAVFPVGMESTGSILFVRLILVAVSGIIILMKSLGQPIERENTAPEKAAFEISKINTEDHALEMIQSLTDGYLVQKREDAEQDIQVFLKDLLSVAQTSFAAHSVLVFLINQERDRLVLKAYASEESFQSGMEVQYDAGLFQAVFSNGETQIFGALGPDDNAVDFRQVQIKSVLAVPIIIQKDVVGVLALYSPAGDAFGGEDPALAEQFSRLMSETILSYTSLFEYEISNRLFSSLFEIGKELNTNLKFDEILNMFDRIIQKVFTYDRVSISMLDQEKNNGIVKRVIGFSGDYQEGYTFSLEDGLNGWVLRTNKSILVADIEKGEYFIPRYAKSEKSNFGIHSFLAAPLSSQEQAIGVVTVENRTPNAYTDRHERVLVMLANHFSVALERSLMNERLEAQAVTDGLTRIHNYRAFQRRLNEEINRSQRSGQPLSLLMMDIDHFKIFNDQYGHLAGDDVLMGIAQTLQTSLREVDFVARYGGEEFGALLIENTMTAAKMSAERIRTSVEALKFIIDGEELHVTISIGISDFPHTADAPKDLILKADKALYQAKDLGRNRVVLYQEHVTA